MVDISVPLFYVLNISAFERVDTFAGDKHREAASSYTSYPNTSSIHIPHHWRSLLYGAGIVS